MIIVEKGNTQSELVATLSENMFLYPNTATGSVYLYLINDINGKTYSIPDLVDLSLIPNRMNIYVIDETTYDFSIGNHKYYFYTTPTSNDLLEQGKFIVTGTSSATQSVYL